jgi:hypothetical protein
MSQNIVKPALLPSGYFPLVRLVSQARSSEPMRTRQSPISLTFQTPHNWYPGWTAYSLVNCCTLVSCSANFDLEDGGDTFLRNVGSFRRNASPPSLPSSLACYLTPDYICLLKPALLPSGYFLLARPVSQERSSEPMRTRHSPIPLTV